LVIVVEMKGVRDQPLITLQLSAAQALFSDYSSSKIEAYARLWYQSGCRLPHIEQFLTNLELPIWDTETGTATVKNAGTSTGSRLAKVPHVLWFEEPYCSIARNNGPASRQLHK
jgi:hypothetical protein